MLAVFASGWAFGAAFAPDKAASFRPERAIAILFPLGLILLLAGGFLYFLSEDGESEFKPRVVFFPLACMFIAQGLGYVAHGLLHDRSLEPIPISFVVLGAVGLIAGEVIIRHLERNRMLRERVIRSGVRTQGEVTRARGYFLNDSPVTRVTVAFVDSAGQKRWASQTVGGTARVGQVLTVRYLPADLGRRAGVVIED